MRYLIAFIFIIALCGCGKNKVPPPPTAHTLLVKKLFYNLEKKEHEAAVKRIEKVRVLDTSNEFLIQMEEREFCNHYIKLAQKQIDANNILKATAIIASARKRYPLNLNLLAIYTKLNHLSELKKHIDLLNSAISSNEMNLQINAIAQFIKKYPEGKILIPPLRKKILRAFKQKLYEQQRARFDLLCDIKTARDAKVPDESLSNTLLAILAKDNAATVNKNERISSRLLD
jgi:hypothetical protein